MIEHDVYIKKILDMKSVREYLKEEIKSEREQGKTWNYIFAKAIAELPCQSYGPLLQNMIFDELNIKKRKNGEDGDGRHTSLGLIENKAGCINKNNYKIRLLQVRAHHEIDYLLIEHYCAGYPDEMYFYLIPKNNVREMVSNVNLTHLEGREVTLEFNPNCEMIKPYRRTWEELVNIFSEK